MSKYNVKCAKVRTHFPLPLTPNADLPDAVPSNFRQQIDRAIKKLAKLTLTQAEQDATVAEARKFRDEGLDAIHAWLKKPGMENARKAAEIEERLTLARKTHAEADGIQVDNREKERLAMIRDLLLIVDLERARQTSSLDNFANILRRLDK